MAVELDWANPRLLCNTDGGLLSIVNGIPRTYDGTEWTNYDRVRVLANQLEADVWTAPQAVVQAPDSSLLDATLCATWVEVTKASAVSDLSELRLMVGVKSDSGSWVIRSKPLADTLDAGDLGMSRVAHDGTNFWVFSAFGTDFTILVIDIHGQEVATSTYPMIWEAPGYWDIQKRPGEAEVVLAQPAGASPSADNGVQLTRFSQALGVISANANTDSTIHCSGPVQFITNDVDVDNLYLATVLTVGDDHTLWGYQVDSAEQTLEYDMGATLAGIPDTLTGYVVDEAADPPDPGPFGVVISQGQLSNQTVTAGPEFDPAYRYIQSYSCSSANVSEFIRQTNSVCQVSRAFKVNDDYYATTYYQSGSGDSGEEEIEVELEDGDYMYGPRNQPLAINLGDYVQGSPFSAGSILGNNSVLVSSDHAPWGIPNTSTVAETTASGLFGVVDGTRLALWTFIGQTVAVSTGDQPMLVVAGSSVTDADGEYLIVASDNPGGNGTIWTLPRGETGIVPVGTFTAVGTAVQTKMARYAFPQSAVENYIIGQPEANFFVGGQMTVSGTGGPDDGVKAIHFVTIPNNPNSATVFYFHVVQTTEVSFHTPYTAIIEPEFPNHWEINTDDNPIRINAADVGSSIVLSGDTNVPGNNGSHVITSSGLDTGGDTALVSEYFQTPPPTASILLDSTKHPFTFFIQGVTFDYRYINALISVTGTVSSGNWGLYRITQVLDANTVVTVPLANGDDAVNTMLTDDDFPWQLSILLASAQAPQYQPCYFMTPLGDVDTAQVGCFDRGLAYADWRREALASEDLPANPYLLQVSSVGYDDDGLRMILPYRSETVTVESSQTIGGNTSSAALLANTIGLKQIKLLNQCGVANEEFSMLPGPKAAQLDGDTFSEFGFNLGLEQPFLISESEESGVNALLPGETYFYAAVLEAFDKLGNRIWTAPSPALQVTMTGDNNVPVIGGRLPSPLDSDGQPELFYHGITDRLTFVLSLYRTAVVNGVPTTFKYKITNDLIPNGLSPVSETNGSGFEFPDQFSWTYTDQNPDGVIISNELMYTDRGLLPRFAPSPYKQLVRGWLDRDWLLSYDGSIGFSGAATEGEQDWFSPLFRIPADARPTAVGSLEGYLVVMDADSKWQLPAFRAPDAAGLNGNIQSLVKLPLAGGCTGLLKQIHGGVAYSNSFGGIWFMTRDLRDEWLSRDLIDTFNTLTPVSMAVDAKQRLHVLTNSTGWLVYDQICRRWYQWNISDGTGVQLSTVKDGLVYYQSNQCVASLDPELHHDAILGQVYGTPPGFTVASLSFGSIAAVVRMYLLQLRGTYKGPHRQNITISYEDINANQDPTVMPPFTPASSDPYVLDCYPLCQEASMFGLDVQADFTGIEAPEDSFELDVFTAEIGVNGRAGANRSLTQVP